MPLGSNRGCSSSGVSTKNQGMMASKGGDGGEAGLGGSGGRILQISVTCDPGTKFSIHIGKGGAGGGHSGSDSVQGSEGSATTFGTYTSADGAASNAGYLDLITGEVYAARGAAGIPGGKGGGTKDNATAGDDEPNEPGGSVVDDSGTVWLPGATPQPPIPIKSYLEGAYDSNREKAGDLYAGAGPGIGGQTAQTVTKATEGSAAHHRLAGVTIQSPAMAEQEEKVRTPSHPTRLRAIGEPEAGAAMEAVAAEGLASARPAAASIPAIPCRLPITSTRELRGRAETAPMAAKAETGLFITASSERFRQALWQQQTVNGCWISWAAE